MRKILSILAFSLLSISATCQNGPTKPSVSLSWAQSTATGVTANCIYRGSAAGTYSLPALFCSTAPITSYTDTTVSPGTVYHYAVTAQVSTTESQFSNDGLADVPALPAAPTLNTPGPVTGKLQKPQSKDAPADVVATVVWDK